MIILLIAMLLANAPAKESTHSIESLEISFCNFEVPKDIMMANASFNLVYTFKVDGRGRPFSIMKVEGRYVQESAVASCIREWRLRRVNNDKTFLATFHWQHGVGWDQIAVSGPGFSEKIRMLGRRCPY